MSIETAVTRAWQRQALWLWLLLPISWLYGLITMLRRQAYKIGLLSSYRAPIPIMVIGNISVGGSGKTPLIIALVNYLQDQGGSAYLPEHLVKPLLDEKKLFLIENAPLFNRNAYLVTNDLVSEEWGWLDSLGDLILPKVSFT